MSTVKINKIVGFVSCCFFFKLHRPSEQLGHETIAVKFFFPKKFSVSSIVELLLLFFYASEYGGSFHIGHTHHCNDREVLFCTLCNHSF